MASQRDAAVTLSETMTGQRDAAVTVCVLIVQRVRDLIDSIGFDCCCS
jgi:hypothetical protein